MKEQQSSYRQIVKSSSIFGGVRFVKILVQIVKSKFVAVLLGPEGMGIYGLLTATTSMIEGLTSFGLCTSAVKNVAEANSTQNEEKLGLIVSVFRRWIWFTGLLGALVTLFLAPFLSKITFLL